MTTDITLRVARADEADFFLTTRRDGFRAYVEQKKPWVDEVQRQIAEAEFHAAPVEIIERAGMRIGYLVVERHTDHWFLDEIALVAEARGQGIGTGLVRTVMTAAKSAALPLRLSVLEGNPALRLYERLAFRVTRREPPRIKMEWP